MQPVPPILEMRHITKTYPGVRALDDVTFSVQAGEVHALVGENGAGKSTLMKILAGAEQADQGEIRINGTPVAISSPLRAMDYGISIIYQEFNLVPYLSVAENIFLGREPCYPLGFIKWSQMMAQAEEILARLGTTLNPRATVQTLSVAQQQMVEIAKALSIDAKIIAMDEPSATLTEHELENLFNLIRSLKAQGVSIIYISHRLEEIFQVADRVTVLRDGRLVDTNPVSEIDRDGIIRRMVGRELKENFPKRPVQFGEEALRVEGLRRAGVLEDISFSVRRGEILGIAGLVGAGRTELARAIFGADRRDAGQIFVHGRPVQIRHPADAIRHGIGLMTEDRKLQGLILGMVVRENTTLANLPAVSRLGFINRRQEAVATRRFVDSLSIRTPSIEQTVRNLSGGTQQKVVLAKWLFTHSDILIFDEPTRGIDVGSKVEIYELMNELVERGSAVIMISSELPEILGMSDRILVMHEGRIAGILSREEATPEQIMHLATGGQ